MIINKRIHILAPSDAELETGELALSRVDPKWSNEELLNADGIFDFMEVVGRLKLPSAELKKKASDLETEGRSSWEIMGIQRAWNRWIVRMKAFGRYLKTHSISEVRGVDSGWDGNALLCEKGRFYLTDVCEKIPFTTHQIRHQVRRHDQPRESIGVWKDPDFKTYIVEMEIFSKWIRRLWR